MMRELRHQLKALVWKRRGSMPDAPGWNAAKWVAIRKGIIANNDGQYGYGDPGIDERVVEYAWVFDRMKSLSESGQRVLDAGSILNHPPIIEAWNAGNLPPVSIVTLAYEGKAFVSDGVRYEFGDLRQLPYRDELFSVVLCISTLEHVGLDTRVYGGVSESTSDPATETTKAMRELYRVTRRDGTMLLSVPFGTSARRSWIRVFDGPDLTRLIESSPWTHLRSRFFRATPHGWRECAERDAASAGYNEPPDRDGGRTAPPFVAAAESVALVELRRPS